MRVHEHFVSERGSSKQPRCGSSAVALLSLRSSSLFCNSPLATVVVWLAGLASFQAIFAADPAPADITSLTREQAAALVEKAGGPLVLPKLSAIGSEVALALARHGGGLALDGLPKLDAAAARAIALHGRVPATAPADLDVDELLAKITDLAGGDDGPDVEGIEKLLAGLGGAAEGADADDGANAVGNDEEPEPAEPTGDAWLSLGGLRDLDAGLAAALAMHEGPLLLDGVRELSVEAAEALASHVGELSLAGLKSLPEDVRDALAEHDGPVAIPDALVGK